MDSRGTCSSQWHGQIWAGQFAMEIADGLWLGCSASMICHTVKGVCKYNALYRTLPPELLEEPQDSNQSRRDEKRGRTWEDTIGRRVGVSLLEELEKTGFQCCFWKSGLQEPMLWNMCLLGTWHMQISPLNSVKVHLNVFEIGAMVTSKEINHYELKCLM